MTRHANINYPRQTIKAALGLLNTHIFIKAGRVGRYTDYRQFDLCHNLIHEDVHITKNVPRGWRCLGGSNVDTNMLLALQPGRLAQGPEEKQAFRGRRRGACDERNKGALLSCCSACPRWREY